MNKRLTQSEDSTLVADERDKSRCFGILKCFFCGCKKSKKEGNNSKSCEELQDLNDNCESERKTLSLHSGADVLECSEKAELLKDEADDVVSVQSTSKLSITKISIQFISRELKQWTQRHRGGDLDA